MQIAIDSSVFVALLVTHDKWHQQSVSLLNELKNAQHTVIYFDCVIAEALSTILRRLHEQKRMQDIPALFTQIAFLVPQDTITWIFPNVADFYPQILLLMQSSNGDLNFHDALIALACQQRGISAIASFDEDFDQIQWLQRIATAQTVSMLE